MSISAYAYKSIYYTINGLKHSFWHKAYNMIGKEYKGDYFTYSDLEELHKFLRSIEKVEGVAKFTGGSIGSFFSYLSGKTLGFMGNLAMGAYGAYDLLNGEEKALIQKYRNLDKETREVVWSFATKKTHNLTIVENINQNGKSFKEGSTDGKDLLGKGFKIDKKPYYVRPLYKKLNGKIQATGEFEYEEDKYTYTDKRINNKGKYIKPISICEALIKWHTEEKYNSDNNWYDPFKLAHKKSEEVIGKEVRAEYEPRYYKNLEESIINNDFDYSKEEFDDLVNYKILQLDDKISKEAKKHYKSEYNVSYNGWVWDGYKQTLDKIKEAITNDYRDDISKKLLLVQQNKKNLEEQSTDVEYFYEEGISSSEDNDEMFYSFTETTNPDEQELTGDSPVLSADIADM